MQTNLPPLKVDSAQDYWGVVILGTDTDDLTEAQAALVIDIVEVRYPRLVEALTFYARKDIYEMGTDWVFNGEDEVGIETPSEADTEGGALARQTLASLESK
jgi:hypothetical protein